MQEIEKLAQENEMLKRKLLEKENLILKLQTDFKEEEKLSLFLEEAIEKEAEAFLNFEVSKELDRRLEEENYDVFDDYEMFKHLNMEEEHQLIEMLKDYSSLYKELTDKDVEEDSLKTIFQEKFFHLKSFDKKEEKLLLIEKAVLSLTVLYKRICTLKDEEDK